jgi:SAM-dependent methyltransferase
MITHKEMVGIQAEKHELVTTNNFASVEGFVLHLIHEYAYHFASKRAAGKRVLDLGCNVGYGTKILSALAGEAIGVDVSERAVAEAKKNFPELRFSIVDGHTLPFDNGIFDMVVSCQVIEHIVDHSKYISEIQRVLTNDAEVIFTTPNSRIRLDQGMKPWNTFHVQEFEAGGLKELLSAYFNSVVVLGLFAREDIYQIEKDRLDRARENARNAIARRECLDPHPTGGGWTAALKRALPSWLRTAMEQAIRIPQTTTNKKAPSAEELQFMKRCGLDDLSYSCEDIDKSLDLLAVCSRPRTTTGNSGSVTPLRSM